MNIAHVVVYSGGMDSYTLLHHVMNKVEVDNNLKPSRSGSDVFALSFDYGQRHKKELRYAAEECQLQVLPHTIIDLRALAPVMGLSALTSRDVPVPEGHYQAESMKDTVVFGRNTIMLSIAMAHAQSIIQASEGHYREARVWYGAHSGDHHIYPDCRYEYTNNMNMTMMDATEDKVRLRAPYVLGDKAFILQQGYDMGLDYSKSWTCYKGGEVPCGVCGSCVERAEAFKTVGRVDPLLDAPTPPVL